MLKDFLDKLEECFDKELQAKTNWGRNEVKAAFKQALNETLIWVVQSKTVVPNKFGGGLNDD